MPTAPLARIALLAVALIHAGTTAAAQPPEGRYRCYQPPAYAVMAWFDLSAAGLSVNGDAPQPVRFDPATGRIDWSAEAFAPYRHGFYFPPGAPGGDGTRITIVLAPRANLRPGQPAWAKLPRCYPIIH